MHRLAFGLVAVLAVALGLVVGTFNSDKVHLDLLWLQLDWPLGLLILIAFAAGLLLGLSLILVFHVLPLRMKVRKLQAASRAAAQDLAAPDD